MLGGGGKCVAVWVNATDENGPFYFFSGSVIWRALNALFEWMPVGALVDGQILAVHGGLGASLVSLSQLRWDMHIHIYMYLSKSISLK